MPIFDNTQIPSYNNFKGSVWRSSSSSTSVITRGIYQLLSDSTIEVTELPIGRWTEDYKRFLDKNSGGKNGLIRVRFPVLFFFLFLFFSLFDLFSSSISRFFLGGVPFASHIF